MFYVVEQICSFWLVVFEGVFDFVGDYFVFFYCFLVFFEKFEVEVVDVDVFDQFFVDEFFQCVECFFDFFLIVVRLVEEIKVNISVQFFCVCFCGFFCFFVVEVCWLYFVDDENIIVFEFFYGFFYEFF